MLPVTLPETAARRLGRAFGINIRRGPSYTGTALVLNTRRPPFNRPAVRKAVSDALELGRVVRNVGPAAAAEQGYVHPDSAWSPRTRLHRFDLAAARRVFRAADLPSIRVLAPDNDPVEARGGAPGGAGPEARRRQGPDGRGLARQPGPRDRRGRLARRTSRRPSRALRRLPRTIPTSCGGCSAPVRAMPRSTTPATGAAEFERLAGRVAAAPTRRARRDAVTDELRLLANDAPVDSSVLLRGNVCLPPGHPRRLGVREGLGDPRQALVPGRCQVVRRRRLGRKATPSRWTRARRSWTSCASRRWCSW